MKKINYLLGLFSRERYFYYLLLSNDIKFEIEGCWKTPSFKEMIAFIKEETEALEKQPAGSSNNKYGLSFHNLGGEVFYHFTGE